MKRETPWEKHLRLEKEKHLCIEGTTLTVADIERVKELLDKNGVLHTEGKWYWHDPRTNEVYWGTTEEITNYVMEKEKHD